MVKLVGKTVYQDMRRMEELFRNSNLQRERLAVQAGPPRSEVPHRGQYSDGGSRLQLPCFAGSSATSDEPRGTRG